MENGHIFAKSSNSISLDEGKRTGQANTDSSSTSQQYGKTLNVPDSSNVLHTLPTVTLAAPINPTRPAMVSTPKSSMISVKNPSTSLALSPTETRPLLLVTTDKDQQQPQTTAVPNGRRLPLNGRIATIVTTKQRKQPILPSNTDHQMINETTTTSTTAQKPVTRKYATNRPRAALFFTSSRMRRKKKPNETIFIFENPIHLGGPDQSPEQRQPLLGSSGNETSSRHDSIDSHASTDDGFGFNESWSVAPRSDLISISIETKLIRCSFVDQCLLEFEPFLIRNLHL